MRGAALQPVHSGLKKEPRVGGCVFDVVHINIIVFTSPVLADRPTKVWWQLELARVDVGGNGALSQVLYNRRPEGVGVATAVCHPNKTSPPELSDARVH